MARFDNLAEQRNASWTPRTAEVNPPASFSATGLDGIVMFQRGYYLYSIVSVQSLTSHSSRSLKLAD